jgi:putative membrane protein
MPERWALGVALVATVAFGVYGRSTGAHSTLGYVTSVVIVATALGAIRRTPLHPALAAALGALVVGHLAGGLVQVGDDVLYNAHPKLHALQYDHVFHASASAMATVVLCGWLRPHVTAAPLAIVFAGLGALGLGALNELVEFVSTLAHDGGHVGGYLNTGWDFVSNTLGVVAACTSLLRVERTR